MNFAISTPRTDAQSSNLGIVCPWCGAIFDLPITNPTSTSVSVLNDLMYATAPIACSDASQYTCNSLRKAPFNPDEMYERGM